MAYDTGNLGGVSVLVIEDDPNIREGLSMMLPAWGCRVRDAGSLSEAHHALAQGGFVPDVIITDLRLDGLGGRSSVEDLPTMLCGLGFTGPVVAITGDTRPGIAEGVATAGWTLLTKPFAAAQLHATLTSLARRPRASGGVEKGHAFSAAHHSAAPPSAAPLSAAPLSADTRFAAGLFDQVIIGPMNLGEEIGVADIDRKRRHAPVMPGVDAGDEIVRAVLEGREGVELRAGVEVTHFHPLLQPAAVVGRARVTDQDVVSHAHLQSAFENSSHSHIGRAGAQ